MSKTNQYWVGWGELGRGIFRRFVQSLVKYFSYYLTEAVKRRIVAQWLALPTRLVRQKIINPNKAFTNLLVSRLDDVRDCLILPEV